MLWFSPPFREGCVAPFFRAFFRCNAGMQKRQRPTLGAGVLGCRISGIVGRFGDLKSSPDTPDNM